MGDSEPRLDDLEIDIVTITRDGDGLVTVEGGGLHDEAISHLLLVGAYVHASTRFEEAEDEDDDDD